MKSNCEEGEVVYIIRDHDKAKFLAKKEFVKELVEKVNKKHGREVVKLELKDEYYNMGEIIKDHMYVVDIAKQAMENLGIKPLIKAIRGGTDGSKISFMGLPTPNISAFNFTISTMTSVAFSILSRATNSYFPWKFSPPAKIFG